MALSYPLALPSRGPRRLRIEPVSVVGLLASPLTGEQTVYAWPGDWWEAFLELGDLNRDEGEEWAAFITALNGREGTFLLGDPLGATPRGTWAGAPLLKGAHAAAIKTLTVDGLSVGATGKAGDWIQFGSGSSTRLHKVMVDFTADGLGEATIEIWPRLRAALADNTPLTTSSAKGLWRLNSNRRGWDLEDVRIGGIALALIEARDG